MENKSEVAINEKVINFFQCSDLFDYLVTKQLSHIKSNWELIWNHDEKKYMPEEDSYAEMINDLVVKISKLSPPNKYHDNEDRLAEFCKTNLGWDIKKNGNHWVGHDYASILEQGAFDDVDERNLLLAVSGRVKAALDRGQMHFDDMEESHRKMLADVLAIILFHRDNRT
jgi:hypothetical protein